MKVPCRIETVRENPAVVLDGAHNAASAKVLRKTLEKYFRFKRILLVFGISGNKDIVGVMKILLPMATEAVFPASPNKRLAKPDQLVRAAKSIGFTNTRIFPGVRDALGYALDKAGAKDLVCVTGSFYTAGDAKKVLCAA